MFVESNSDIDSVWKKKKGNANFSSRYNGVINLFPFILLNQDFMLMQSYNS